MTNNQAALIAACMITDRGSENLVIDIAEEFLIWLNEKEKYKPI